MKIYARDKFLMKLKSPALTYNLNIFLVHSIKQPGAYFLYLTSQKQITHDLVETWLHESALKPSLNMTWSQNSFGLIYRLVAFDLYSEPDCYCRIFISQDLSRKRSRHGSGNTTRWLSSRCSVLWCYDEVSERSLSFLSLFPFPFWWVFMLRLLSLKPGFKPDYPGRPVPCNTGLTPWGTYTRIHASRRNWVIQIQSLSSVHRHVLISGWVNQGSIVCPWLTRKLFRTASWPTRESKLRSVVGSPRRQLFSHRCLKEARNTPVAKAW